MRRTAPAGCRVDDSHFPDGGEFLQYPVSGKRTAAAGQMPAEQRLQHQGQHADEHVDADFLVGPVMLGADRKVPGILEIAEGALDMVLGAVSMHDLCIAQIATVGEDQVLAEQGLLQALPGLAVEAVGQSGQAACAPVDGDPEKFLHVLGLETMLDPFADSVHGRMSASGDEALLPASELPLDLAQLLPAAGDFAQQRGRLRLREVLVFHHHDRVVGAMQPSHGPPG